MRWRLVFIIEVKSKFEKNKQHEKLNRNGNDGDPAPQVKGNSPKRKSSRSNGATALFFGQTKSNSSLLRVSQYIINNIFWPFLVFIIGNIILSFIW
jgi:hypothetical protein